MVSVILRAFIPVFLLSTFYSCSTNQNDQEEVGQIVIGVKDEPYTLNPILSTASSDREIYHYVFSRLADRDYESLELKPVLLKSLPETTINEDGSKTYDMELKGDANWDNGAPLTAEDVHFTFKVAAHPGINSPVWKALLPEIKGIELNPENPRKFKIHSESENFQSLEYILSSYIFPEHIFDPNQILKNHHYNELSNPEVNSELMKDSSFVQFAKAFSSVTFSKENIQGSGPYHLETWNTGQYIVLNKKSNYWGTSYEDTDQLESYPSKIVFQFFPDLTTAITTLKNKELDLLDLSRLPYTQFDDLKENTSFANSHNFYTPSISRYLILLLNNEDERLSEIPVRKALRHLTNVDRIVNQLEGGYGKRILSPIDSDSEDYNPDLEPSEFSIEKANQILNEANWIDTDGDGIRDKVINGFKEDLNFRFHITGSEVSRSLSGIIKEACEEAGISIELIIKPFGATRAENINTGDYDITIMVKTPAPVRRDVYPSYHSNSIGSGGGNYQRYSNLEADQLMELIRGNASEDSRKKAYKRLQEIFDEEVPVIYLYSPQLKIVSSKEFDHTISSKRPGYFANAIAE